MSGTVLCGRTFLQSKPRLKAAPSGETFKEKREERENATWIPALITPGFSSFAGVLVKHEQIKTGCSFRPCAAPAAGHLVLGSRFYSLYFS